MTRDFQDSTTKNCSEHLSDELPLSSRICVHQMLRTQVAFRRALQRSVQRHRYGITFEMFQVLSILWFEEGITQQDLAQRTAKNKASMTSLVCNLERKGFIRRVEGSVDHRNKLVYLTESGKALEEMVMPGVYEVYRSIEKELGEESLTHMFEQLCDMENALKNY